MSTEFYAKFNYATPPQATALFKVIDNFIGLYFDKGGHKWVLDASVLFRTIDDMDVQAITPEQAAELETRFRAA